MPYVAVMGLVVGSLPKYLFWYILNNIKFGDVGLYKFIMDLSIQ